MHASGPAEWEVAVDDDAALGEVRLVVEDELVNACAAQHAHASELVAARADAMELYITRRTEACMQIMSIEVDLVNLVT